MKDCFQSMCHDGVCYIGLALIPGYLCLQWGGMLALYDNDRVMIPWEERSCSEHVLHRSADGNFSKGGGAPRT